MKKNLILFFAVAVIFTANAQQIPVPLVGNWIETQSNNWEYGFFEKFAVYDCGFWDYASVQQKGKTTKIVLQKDGKTVNLDIRQKNDSVLTIKNGKSKKQDFVLMRKRYPEYKTADNEEFPAPTFRQNSATIIGYYRNFDKLPELLSNAPDWLKNQYFNNVFRVAISDFISERPSDYQTTIDSLGRFSLTFPIINSQETYVDWGRLTRQLVFSPHDTLFLFADMNDLIADPNVDYWKNFYLREKQILFMGDNARLNNELLQYKSTYKSFNPHETAKKGIVDMDFLKLCTEDYEKRKNNLENYISTHPNVSEKFRFYKRNWEIYQLAFDLLQHKYSLPQSYMRRFSDGYMDYIEKNIPKFNPQVYTLIREYQFFIRDYIYYYSGNKTIDHNVRMFVEETGLNTPENIQLLDEYDNFVEKLVAEKDTAKQAKIIESDKDLLDKVNVLTSNPLIQELREAYVRRVFIDMDYHKADSLLQDPVLKELWTTHLYLEDFEQKRLPWKEQDLQVLKTRVTRPFLQDTLLKVNDYYVELNKRELLHPESLKNTAHLANENNADTIFNKLIEPYKGKVIFVDFWGTWCSPCIENIKSYSRLYEERFKDKDLIFMYFANRSSEYAWKNFIKQQQLTGEQIVHYRLSEQQEILIEQKLNVRGSPSYFIIDRTGNITDYKVSYPMNFENTAKELERLLNNTE
ncbi:MAG: TlpA family protein disulfide reductase [Dysgonamonadaceae bacterium]|jgi:thiol-disulfide isomerase/thioredoxin|nr:TlpA family protein disulfide reductase [Dysgonamonadaceae bacterium]